MTETIDTQAAQLGLTREDAPPANIDMAQGRELPALYGYYVRRKGRKPDKYAVWQGYVWVWEERE